MLTTTLHMRECFHGFSLPRPPPICEQYSEGVVFVRQHESTSPGELLSTPGQSVLQGQALRHTGISSHTPPWPSDLGGPGGGQRQFESWDWGGNFYSMPGPIPKQLAAPMEAPGSKCCPYRCSFRAGPFCYHGSSLASPFFATFMAHDLASKLNADLVVPPISPPYKHAPDDLAMKNKMIFCMYDYSIKCMLIPLIFLFNEGD